MPDAASRAEGGRVLMVSSLDAEHPGDNVIDGSEASYWLSTGLYPQSILLALAYPCRVSVVQLAATCVRAVRIEGCPDGDPVNFHVLAEAKLRDAGRNLQLHRLACSQSSVHVVFLRVVILAGWHDFCSVHTIRVESPRLGPSPSASRLADADLADAWGGDGGAELADLCSLQRRPSRA